jgi:hypothetical protein
LRRDAGGEAQSDRQESVPHSKSPFCGMTSTGCRRAEREPSIGRSDSQMLAI